MTIEAHQHVEPNGEDLEPQEDDDQVISRDHEQRPRGGGQRQDVKVRPRDALALRPVVGHQGREQNPHRNDDGAHDREAVEHHRVGDRGRGPVVGDVGPLEKGDDDRRDRRQGGDRGGEVDRDLGIDERTHHQQQQRRTEEDQHREDREVVDRGDYEAVHFLTPAGATWWIS